jgi:DNA repair protein RadC
MIKSKALLHKLTYPIPTFTLYMVRENKRSYRPVRISTPKDTLNLLTPLSLAAEEYFIALHLNVKHEVIGITEIAHGTLTESLIHPREVFKAAILANSFAIIICHNHPSGSIIVPSREDYLTTKHLIRASKIIGILLVDHLILGCELTSDKIYSFREKHADLWSEKSDFSSD